MTMVAAEEGSRARPLEGITVVAVEHAVAAPFATRQLADLGARVIKVERPGGGDFARSYDRAVQGASSYFVWLNRGKQSVVLDLRDPDDRGLLRRMIASADVFVENLAPGSAARLGLDPDSLCSQRPDLIHCSISGYGEGGPYSAKKAYDLLIQCEGGVLDVTGTPGDRVKVGFSVVDIATGMYAYSGILTALFERLRTGRGSVIDVSMLDAIGEWMSQPMIYSAYGGIHPQRTGAQHPTISPYGPYRVGDGSTVFVGIQNDREWRVFCERVLGRPELSGDPRFTRNPERVVHDAESRAVIEEVFASRRVEELIASLEEAGIACARARSAADSWKHPQRLARRRLRRVVTPTGEIEALLPPVTVRGREAAMGAVPALGEHTEALRAEFPPCTTGEC